MERNERFGDFEEAQQRMLEGFQAALWTALPAIVVDVQWEHQTISAQPAVQAVIRQKDGSRATVNMPLLMDIPICFPRGGSGALTLPIQPGDDVLVVFASRCIDMWWTHGGSDNLLPELRMHDLSDGFAVLAPTSLPSLTGFYDAPSGDGGSPMQYTRLRSVNGSDYVEVGSGEHVMIRTPGVVTIAGNDNGGKCQTIQSSAESVITVCTLQRDMCSTHDEEASQTYSLTAGTSVTIQAPTINLVGNVVINGNLTVAGAGGAGSTMTLTGNINHTNGSINSNGVVVHTHTHGGVQTGGSDTGAPNAG